MVSFHELVISYQINIPKLHQLLIEINFVIINKIYKTTQFQVEFSFGKKKIASHTEINSHTYFDFLLY